VTGPSEPARVGAVDGSALGFICMETFFCKLIPPRNSFAQDLSVREAQLMRQHVEYWRSLPGSAKVVAFARVADPRGTYGLCIVEVEGEAEANKLTERDPVILASVGFRYEIHSMPRGVIHR